MGRKVEHIWHAIPTYYPEVEVIALQLMPDHLHGILFVKTRTDYHLGKVIKGFKIASNRTYRAAIEEQVSPFTAPSPPQRQCRCGGDDHPKKQGFLWSIGYTDSILDHKGQLETWKNYLRDIPKRLLIKRIFPEYFRVQRQVKIGTYECSVIGNRFLLTKPLRLQVQCSRSMMPEQIAKACEYYMQQAQAGAVLVSPCISLGEKHIMRTIISRAQCLALNDLAREICE